MKKRSLPTKILLLLNIAWIIRVMAQFLWQLRRGENGFTSAALILFSGYGSFFVGYLLDWRPLRRAALAWMLAGNGAVDLYLWRHRNE